MTTVHLNTYTKHEPLRVGHRILRIEVYADYDTHTEAVCDNQVTKFCSIKTIIEAKEV